jgi:hypothetical protein
MMTEARGRQLAFDGRLSEQRKAIVNRERLQIIQIRLREAKVIDVRQLVYTREATEVVSHHFFTPSLIVERLIALSPGSRFAKTTHNGHYNGMSRCCVTRVGQKYEAPKIIINSSSVTGRFHCLFIPSHAASVQR